MTRRLECAGLSGGYGKATAFRDVDLSIEAGAVEALLGPNGAGKTTMLLTMAGFLPPKAGTVSVDEKPLKAGRPSLANKAGIVLVPDRRNIFTTLSVHDNLKVAAHKGGPKPEAMLDLFPALEKRWTLRAGALSGGEQQMLAMARALIQEPKVLLVDEMSMGLAPLIVEKLFEIVDRIATELGCAVLLVEQHVGLALEVATTASVLNRGEIVLRGSAAELRGETDRLEAAYFGAPGTNGHSEPNGIAAPN
jgi:branched-chain amino acid transport system ATP-binding protein